MAEAQSQTDYRPPAPAGPGRSGESARAAVPDRPHAAAPEGARSADRPGEAGGDTTESGRTLVKVTVNLTPRAVDALDVTCARTRDSKTDTINRALVVYQIVLDLMDRGGGQLMFQDQQGHTERIHLL